MLKINRKTILLKSMQTDERNYVSLDDLSIRDLAKEDPKLFLLTYQAPLIIDEVQHAPQLFSYIKLEVDNSDEKGLYWLSGSQKFHLMKNVSESLAGRVGILELYSLSYLEKIGRKAKIFDPRSIKKEIDLKPLQVFDAIFKGGMLDILKMI